MISHNVLMIKVPERAGMNEWNARIVRQVSLENNRATFRKGLGDKMSNEGNSRCSSPASGVVSDERNQPSECYNVIIRQLHDEIDRSKMSYKEVEAMVHAHMKDDVQSYLISSDRTFLLSENNAIKLELRDTKSRQETVIKSLHLSLHSAEQENKSSKLTFQQNLRLSEDKVHSMEQKLKEFEGQVLSLQHNLMGSNERTQSVQKILWVSDKRLQSLQQSSNSSEENLQSMKHCLKATDEKAKVLKEALRSLEEKTQSLQEALGVSERRIRAAKAQQQSLEKCKEEKEERIKGLMQILRVSEDKHHSTVQDLQMGLQSAREKVEILQDAMDKTESGHVKEVGKLQQKLNRATKKLSSTEQELHSQIVALNTQLLEEQSKANKELERAVRYEKELQDTIKDLRKKLRTQIGEREFALNSLSMRQKDLADVQHHLKADLLRCRLVCGLEKGPQHFTAHMGGLKEGFFNLRTNLHFVLEKEAGRDDQRRQDWMQVLDKSKEWEKKAEKLVDSLDSLQSHQLLEEEGDERDQYRSVAWRSGASPSPHSPSAVTIPQRNLSTRPASPYPNGQYVGREKKIGPSAHCGLKDSEGMQHLLTVQKRLKNLQSVEFQRNIKGLLRTS